VQVFWRVVEGELIFFMEILFFVLVLIMSIVIHEVSHGWSAYFLGDPTAKLAGRLTLNPIPHTDPIGSVLLPFLLIITSSPILFGWAKPVPYNPYNLKGGRWGPALVALAGPASNIIIALIFSGLIRFSPLFSPGEPLGDLAFFIVIINIVLAVFNLFPIPPLDGSKVLFAVLPYRLKYIENLMVQYQLVLILVLIIFAGALIFPILNFILTLLVGVGL